MAKRPKLKMPKIASKAKKGTVVYNMELRVPYQLTTDQHAALRKMVGTNADMLQTAARQLGYEKAEVAIASEDFFGIIRSKD
jgi:hypothetical protein